MAVTEAAAPSAATADDHEPAAVGGLAGLLGTVDHVVVGRLFVVVSLVLLVVGRVAGILIDAERLDTESTSILDENLGQVFSLHLTTDLLLFLVPAFLGLAIAVVPLQVGASTIAFPRAAAASFWTWLLSAGVFLTSHALDGGGLLGTDRDAILLAVVSLAGVAASLIVGTVCVLTTILALRTAGMTVDRVPMFAWGSFVAGLVWLLSLPVLVAVLVLNYLDVRYGPDLNAFAWADWAFGAPQVFAFAFPLVGVLLDVVPVAAGTRLRNRGVLLGAVAAGAILTFAGDLLEAGRQPEIYQDALYVGGSFALALPLLAILGGVADTLRRGKLNPSSPLVLGLLGFLLLLAGVAANALRVIDNLDLVGTSADSGVVELAVVAGILGVAAAIAFWSTKLVGAQLKEGVGRLAGLVLFVGGLAVGVPDIVSGFLDQPFGVANGTYDDGVEALNGVALAGGIVVLLGVALVILNLAVGRGNGSNGDDGEVPADPWDGHTLEWATASPPAPGGPGPLEPVASATPLLDMKEAKG